MDAYRSQTRTFTATDACGNTATISRTVTWTEDVTPPVFTGSYATVDLGCNPTNIAATLRRSNCNRWMRYTNRKCRSGWS